MKIIVYAGNVHQGGGQKLLTSLILAIEQPAILFVDSRYQLPTILNNQIEIIQINPNIKSRLKAEFYLKRLSRSDDMVICFGNLPPLLKISGRVFVYLQNRYLCTNTSLKGFPIKDKLRIFLERAWLRLFLRNAKIIVQGVTMKRNVYSFLGQNSMIMPFFNSDKSANPKIEADYHYDYLYVASGEPHKNHLKLIAAWILLSEYGLNPSLRLTLNLENDTLLSRTISDKIKKYKLNISSQVASSGEIKKLYTQSKTLIYPSFFESFGLPLLEARDNGLTIIASERDYVRDVIVPHYTFDPDSELSVARAVMRHIGKEQPILIPDDAKTLIKKLLKII
jgi:glycosyltransferase involved in cell wall biosynthesis